ncbi:KipI antagonist [Andreprevotia sp. IGB-42]|uniref:5-oxoprolinase subunit C family protein n=1 Tax=Andreprevotia sp. IGB-42 TaxID=2497473 RepID=UPI00135893D8|nr:biotin-dependent carboxyltransferase family protein [Andreprevotia sp. IGB-42]KAF0811777.1 KipI antagonist [Andreprevotia sp. IGB-42]
MTLTILKPGPLTTVQDMGRSGYAGIGVPTGGACDPLALRVGNLLVANAEQAAGLEISLGGLCVRFDQPAVFALTGAQVSATLDGEPVAMWARVRAAAGQVLALGYAETGARIMLCVCGGVDVPLILGSRATGLLAGLGGFAGRALAAGDVLPLAAQQPPQGAAVVRAPGRGGVLRVLPGPEWPLLERRVQQGLLSLPWRVGAASNRMGARLEGNALAHTLAELDSHAVQPGLLQLPASGQPILLLADAQVTGGYPRPLVVIQADLWRAAQFRPGESLHFVEVGVKDALAALQAQRDWLARLARMLAQVR